MRKGLWNVVLAIITTSLFFSMIVYNQITKDPIIYRLMNMNYDIVSLVSKVCKAVCELLYRHQHGILSICRKWWSGSTGAK